jgi:hypothetical protein
MMYCFVCRDCGYRVETNVREPAPTHFHSWKPGAKKNVQPLREVTMQRDYRTENVAPQVVQLKREREAGGRSAVRDMFLPTAKDFESASDPDGQKGLRKWADETKPKDGNKKPYWPDMKKKTFAVGA